MLTSNVEILDPYREWLDVRIADRPLNAYQLFGLAPGEDDGDAIETAIQRKRELLRSSARNGVPALWRHLHHELNSAAELLRDPKKKAEYDRALFPAGIHSFDQRPQGPVECGSCAEVNAPTRAFCSGCGQPLMAPCARCGVKNVCSETYCGVCGANLKAALEERIEKFDADLAEAERLQAEGYFDEALVVLSGMLSTANPHLEEGVEQGKEMLRRLAERRSQTERQFAADLEAAQSQFEAAEYETAIATLEDTPAGLRDEQCEKLLAICRGRRDEANELVREIRAAVQAQQTAGLLEMVDRLLQLKPGYPQAVKLQLQLVELQLKSDSTAGEKLQRRAKQLLSEQKYAEAVEVLEETPEPAREESFQKIYAFAKETAWLSEAIEKAPVADKALAMASQRLCKLAPKDEGAARALEEIQAAIRKGPADPRHAAPTWKEAGSRRFPCTWLGGFRRLRPSESCDAALLTAHPGRFYVACGLALQGLGLAVVRANLMPSRKKKGVLDSISRFGRKEAPALAAWGVDLSGSGFKAVRLVRSEAGDARIDACVIDESLKSADLPAGEDQALMRLRAALEKFLQGRDLGSDRLCVSLGGIQILPRFFRIPVVEENRLRDAITFEVRHQIPVPLEELAWDFHAFPPLQPKDDARVQDREVLVLAAKQWQLKHPLGAIEESGVEVHAIQSDAAALYNFVRYEIEGELPDETAPAAAASSVERVLVMLDVGRETTNFVCCSPRSVAFRTFPVGGNAFTKALVREFNLTLENAEQLKRAPWKAKSMAQWDEAFDPVYRSFLEEVRRCETTIGRDRRIERLYLCGGGAQLHGLLRRLMQATAAEDGASD
jgi:type IV pilus assembly protein PilM